MFSDLKFAFRSLSKTPGFTAIAVVTMAIAIGACTSLFSVLQAVVLRPLPYPEPDRLVTVWTTNPDGTIQAPAISWPKYELYRTRTDVFAALSMSAGNGFTLTEGKGEPEQVFGLHASANFLPVLGLPLVRGRQFTAEEDKPGGPPVVMISARLWKERFGSDHAILGRVLQVDGKAREVVAILPKLPPPFANTDILVPQPDDLPYLNPQQRQNAVVHQGVARLAPGLTIERANRLVAEMAAQFRAANPNHLDASSRNEFRTLDQQVLGNNGRTLWLLAGAVGAVLLIGCANIANLFLARVSARHKEIAVRLSLGAQRTAVIRQFLAESLLFSVVAGGLGVILAWWSLRGIQVLAGQQIPRADEIDLDPVVLGFSLAIALGAGLLIGLYPAWQAARTDVQGILKDSSRGAGGGTAAKTFRHVLVVAQVALSLTLLICAGLLVRSFYKLHTADLGFTPAGRASGLVNLPSARYSTPEASREFFRRLQEKLSAAPELAGGAATGALPLSGQGFFSPYGIQGRPLPPIQERPLATICPITPEYFATLGIALRTGRYFSTQDRADGEKVAIINESFARKLFSNEPALDHFFITGPKSDILTRIVGVVGDVKFNGLAAAPPDLIYFPREQRGGTFMTVVGHAKPGLKSAAVIPVLRRLLAELDPTVALAQPKTMEQIVSESLAVQRVTLALLISFAAIAALLAAVGVYSVMAYSVTQRTGEIGVRMALGASQGDILRLVLRSGAVQVGLGLVLGVVGAFGASRLLTQALYEVKPFDPAVFALVATFFAFISTLACLIPARRATRVDPMVALRVE